MNARRQSGQALLGVLLLSVLVTSVCLGYARHAVVSAANAQATVATQQAEGVADSGLAWARQTLLADGAHSARLALDGTSSLSVAVADAGSGKKTLTISSTAAGQTQVLEGTVETYATVGGALPSLTAAARAAVPGNPALIAASGTQTFHDTKLTGVLFLRNGAHVTLQNCIVAGSIVSEPALSVSGWAASDATSLTLSGTVVIESDATLAGCSIIAPDAAVSGDGTEAVQITGCVVCRALTLTGWGAISGPIASTRAPALSRAVDLPGSGREPRTWPATLDTGAEGILRVAFPRGDATGAEQSAIRGFTFPAVRGGGP